MNDHLFRFAAVAAAAALLAAPYRQQIQAAAGRALEAVRSQAGLVGRIVAAGLLIAAAWGKVPLPTLPSVAPQVTVVTPSDELQRLVTPVADALAGLSAADRALWAALWTKAGVVAAGDAVHREHRPRRRSAARDDQVRRDHLMMPASLPTDRWRLSLT